MPVTNIKESFSHKTTMEPMFFQRRDILKQHEFKNNTNIK